MRSASSRASRSTRTSSGWPTGSGSANESDPDKIEQDLMRLIPRERVVRLHLRADRPRAGDLPCEEAAVHGVPDRTAVSVEPGVSGEASDRRLQLAAARAGAPAQRVGSRVAPPRRGRPRRRRPGRSRATTRGTAARTAQRRGTRPWRALDLIERPVGDVPTGKKSSGSSPMHAASESHHISSGSCLNRRSVIVRATPRVQPNVHAWSGR